VRWFRSAGELAPSVLVLEDYLLLGAATGLPWVFGGVETWAHRTAALVLVAAAAAALRRAGWDGLGLGRCSRWLLPAALLGVWALAQLVPLPGPVLRVLSPGAHRLHAATFPGYAGPIEGTLPQAIERQALLRVPESAATSPRDADSRFPAQVAGRWSGWRALSLHPAAGQERVFWFIALLLGFLVARRRTHDAAVAEVYRRWLFALFFLLAAFGLLYAAMPNGKLYWVRETLYPARVFGPYVNPTNFGAVMELAVPWLCGYTLLAWRRRSPAGRLRESRVPFFAAASVIGLIAGLATASKGASVLIVSSVAILALVVTRGVRQRLAVLVGAGLLAVSFSVAIVQSPLGKRVREFAEATGGAVSEVDRLVAWRASLPMARDFALTGVGFGATGDAFGRYLPAGEAKRWEHMHNDYLELALEGGAVAVLLAVWLALGYWRRALSGLVDVSTHRLDPAVLGLLLGLAAMSVHALFDFNHQIPADALLFAVAAAIAVGRAEGIPGSRS